RLHPEPRGMLLSAFLAGMIVVPVAGWLESQVSDYRLSLLMTIIIWATIEEMLKFVAAAFCLESKHCDEPLDPMIYLITAALGFAALENTLFIITPLLKGDIIGSLISGNLRFVGASLLHVCTSGILGASMALVYYRSRKIKNWFLILGVVLAITLHTLFNSFIIDVSNEKVIAVFSVVWMTIILLILIFEKVKTISKFKN
ncbi:MAG: PrsW family glutamic-type intramembrane protease, partial [Candidatus Paceibacterota bacterium]